MRGLIMAAQQQARVSGGLLLDQHPTTGFAYTYARDIISNQGNIVEGAILGEIPREQFSREQITDGTLELFADGKDVRVVRWYSVQGEIYQEVNRLVISSNNPRITINGITNIRNNLPVMGVLGDIDLRLLSAKTPNHFSHNDFTWYGVFVSQSQVSGDVIMSETTDAQFNGNGVFSDTGNNKSALDYRPQSTSSLITMQNPLSTITEYHTCIKKTGNLFEAFVNGNKVGEVSSVNQFIDDTLLFIGARGGSANSFKGILHETILYREAHTDTVRNNITNNQMNFFL